MLKGIVKYFIENPLIGNALTIFIFLFGYFGLTSTNSNLTPQGDPRAVLIEIIYPGASPAEIEEGIAVKVEEVLKGLDGIEELKASCSENLAIVEVKVMQGFETDRVLREIENAIGQVSSFPGDMEPPAITKVEFVNQALDFALSGDVELKQLKKTARLVERELLAINGISKVEVSGFPAEEIEISFREADLRKYNLTFDQAVRMVRLSNLQATGGKVKSEQEELLIRLDSKEYYAGDLGQIILQNNPEAGVLRLHQVADIRDQWADSPARVFFKGQPAIKVSVRNSSREDMLAVADKVREYIKTFNQKNELVKAEVIIDFSIELQDRISLLQENGIVGFLLVLVILGLFLHWRLAFWVGMALPVSFAGMFMLISYMGITINMMSMFGMILVIGILVDDGIVIVESIYQKYEAGLPPVQAAVEGTMEVLPAVFAAVITTMIAFGAAFFIEGQLGDLAYELSLVTILCLLFSLVEGALLLPAHIAHSKALKNRDQEPPLLLRWVNQFVVFLKERIYRPILRLALAFPLLMISLCLVALILVFGAFQGGIIKSTFFTDVGNNEFMVELEMPAGTNAAITNEVLEDIEGKIDEVNEELSNAYYNGEKKLIISYIREISVQGHIGNIFVSLLPSEERGDVTTLDVTGALREQVGPIYAAKKLQYTTLSTFGKPVDISLLGRDEAELEAAVIELEVALNTMPELRDVTQSTSEGLKEISLTLTPKAEHYGYTAGEILRQVRQGFFGSEIQKLQRGQDEIKVWVRYESADRSDISHLASMQIKGPGGLAIPLGELADFEIERGISSIQRLNGQQQKRLEAALANDQVLASAVLGKVEGEVVPKILAKYPNVDAVFKGESEQQTKTASTMQLAFGMALLLMFLVLLINLGSLVQTLIIFIIIPFGFIGMGLGHYVMDIPVSMLSVLGLLALVGILVNDALVFLSAFNDQLRAGQSFSEAIYEAGMSRFRPIIITSITTIFGLGPLIFEQSLGAKFLIPMAVSVAFGLFAVTIIILILIPALLQLSNLVSLMMARIKNSLTEK